MNWWALWKNKEIKAAVCYAMHKDLAGERRLSVYGWHMDFIWMFAFGHQTGSRLNGR